MKVSRVLASVLRRFEGDRTGPLVSAAFALSYVLLVVGAMWPSAVLVGVSGLGVYVAESLATRRAAYLTRALRQVRLGQPLRALTRDVAFLILPARTGTLGDGWFAALAVTLILLHVLRAVHSSQAVRVNEWRRLPVLTRGFDLGKLKIPNRPPTFVQEHQSLVDLDLPILAGLVWTVAFGTVWPLACGLALALLGALGALAITFRHVRANRHLRDRDQVMRTVAEQVAAYGPRVALYFSGDADTIYQVNIWLETFDRLPHPKVIIMRERGNLPLLGRTTSPVLCFPGGTEMMNFPMPESLRVALYPANAVKNIHMLRLPEIAGVFIGHGDSDKAASFSPFSKAYDEVWVAGPAGRERYRHNHVGVRDDEIIEVGRPQLAPIDTSGVTPDPMFTVLYAPTWEGWTGDRFHTSVAVMGPTLVRLLLDHAPQVRLLYKPHPMAGKTSAAVRRAHRRIVTMIEQANAARDASGSWSADPAQTAAARSRLAELTARLAEFGAAGAGDEAATARDAARPDLAADARRRETLAEVEQLYWQADGWWRHRVISGSTPHLYACFNRADLVITDVSSVVADISASGKPYVVANGAGLPEEEFRQRNPSVSAAYLVGPDCSGLADILAAVSGDDEDVMAPRRRELKRFLLGSDESDAMRLFAGAVDDLMTERARFDAAI
jgi:hypothetical protein